MAQNVQVISRTRGRIAPEARIGVGLEAVEDIKADLARGLGTALSGTIARTARIVTKQRRVEKRPYTFSRIPSPYRRHTAPRPQWRGFWGMARDCKQHDRRTDAPAAYPHEPAYSRHRRRRTDLVFRIGNGWQSEIVRGMARDRRENRSDPYSHVGMLVGSPPHWQVLHAVPAEIPGRPDAIVRDDLDFFIAPGRAHGIAIYRVAADAATRAAAVDYALQRLGTPFRIIENDREGQYCTTFVWRAWQRAGIELGAHFDYLEIPLAAGNYLLPHSLRTAPGLQLVFTASAESRENPL
ncbi:MAG: hypothetical protein LBP58_10585 [Azoarcus sp.]|jgi:hypothetical protein|nr:hypothetical protein [Azoarcus sp.]